MARSILEAEPDGERLPVVICRFDPMGLAGTRSADGTLGAPTVTIGRRRVGSLLADRTVNSLAEKVGMAGVTGGLLD